MITAGKGVVAGVEATMDGKLFEGMFPVGDGEFLPNCRFETNGLEFDGSKSDISRPVSSPSKGIVWLSVVFPINT